MDHSVEFFNEVKELYQLYDKVKTVIIYAENFDPQKEIYIAPLNQLRSSLDHIFKASISSEKMKIELMEAKAHLDRAGYDAFELLAGNLGNKIHSSLDVYSTTTLAAVFPDYYQTIKPKLVEIQMIIGDFRKRQKESIESFELYFDQIKILMDFNKKVETMIPSLEMYHYKKIKEERVSTLKNRLFGLLLVFLGATLTFLINFFLKRNR